jgi:hypothetical protein
LLLCELSVDLDEDKLELLVLDVDSELSLEDDLDDFELELLLLKLTLEPELVLSEESLFELALD